MKKILMVFWVIGIFSIVSIASTSFSLQNTKWSNRYSERIGNLYLFGIVGTTGTGGALGYTFTQVHRKKVGFFNPIVGKSTYAIALGVNLGLNISPAAYFEYDTERNMLPLFYDFRFTAGNFGLQNFGINLEGKAYSTLMRASIYAEGHFRLVFQKDMGTVGLLDLSYKNMKGTLFFTDEVGSLYFLNAGMGIGPVAIDAGIGYNGKPGLNFGLSSMKSNLSSGWWFRYIVTNLGSSFLCNLNFKDSELFFGYNRGALYVSLER